MEEFEGMKWRPSVFLTQSILLYSLVHYIEAGDVTDHVSTPLTSTVITPPKEEVFISVGVCVLGLIIFLLGLVALIIAIKRYCKDDPKRNQGNDDTELGNQDSGPFTVGRRTSGSYHNSGSDYSQGQEQTPQNGTRSRQLSRQQQHQQMVQDLRRLADLGAAARPISQTPRNQSVPNVYEDTEDEHFTEYHSAEEAGALGYTLPGSTQSAGCTYHCHSLRPRLLSLPCTPDQQAYEDMSGFKKGFHGGHVLRSLGEEGKANFTRERAHSTLNPSDLYKILEKQQWSVSPQSPLLDITNTGKEGHTNAPFRSHVGSKESEQYPILPPIGSLGNYPLGYASQDEVLGTGIDFSSSDLQQDLILKPVPNCLYTRPDLLSEINNNETKKQKSDLNSTKENKQWDPDCGFNEDVENWELCGDDFKQTLLSPNDDQLDTN